MQKKIVSALLLTLLLLGLLTLAFNNQLVRADAHVPVPIVYVEPEVSTASIGEPFTINVTVADFVIRDTPTVNNGLFGWDFNITFDPTIINVTSVQQGPFLGTAGPTLFLPTRINNTAGWVIAGEMIWPRPWPEYGANGTGVLAIISFQVRSVGRTLLNFTSTKLITVILNDRFLIHNVAEGGLFDNREPRVDIDPDTLHLTGTGQWITCYIELPEGYDVSDIDVSTVMLNDTIPIALLDVPASDPVPTEIGDYDDDGIPDLMVKFDRAMVSAFILSQRIANGVVTLAIAGDVNGAPFEGTDTICVLMGGGGTGRRK